MSSSSSRPLAFVCHPADVAPLLAALPPQDSEPPLFVALDRGLAEAVRSTGGECLLLQDFSAGGEELRKTALLWLHQWADHPLVDGKSIKQIATYEGKSLWWFMLPVIFPDFLRCVYFVERTWAVLAAETTSRIVLVDVRGRANHPFRLNHDENLPGKVIALACEAQGRRVEYISPTLASSCSSAFRRLKARAYSAIYYRLGRRLIAFFRRLCASGRREGEGGRPTVMVLSSPVYWRDTVDEQGRGGRNDAIAGSCIQRLSQRGYRLVGLDFEINTPGFKQFAVLRQKAKRRDIAWKAMECYSADIPKVSRVKRRTACRLLVRQFRDSAQLASSLCYKDVPLGGILNGRFNFLFEKYLPIAIEYLQAIEVAICQEHPCLFILVYEEGPYGRAATIAGEKFFIPTLALQHGMLASPYTAAYYFPKVSTDLRADPFSCPIPTCTAIYGEYTEKLLTEVSSYPKDRVAVVGMPAYDQVLRSTVGFSAVRIRADLGMELSRSIVLVISQPFYSRDDRQFYMEMVLTGAAELSEVQWVVKLHPSDRKGEDWKHAIGQRGLTNVIVFERHLHELLFTCDLVVAWASTAMLEAVTFSKPVLAVEIPGCQSAVRFLGSDLAWGVKDVAQLTHMVESVLGDIELRRGMVERGQRVLEQHIHAPDGKATDRLLAVVEGLITQPRTGSSSVAEVVHEPHRSVHGYSGV